MLMLCGTGAGAGAAGEDDKPIIAYLLAEAAHYDGRLVTIYGLVIETSGRGSHFLLQDVSQMPLPIIRNDGRLTLVGDQLLVEGRFLFNNGQPYLQATSISHTKVVGGGGCC